MKKFFIFSFLMFFSFNFAGAATLYMEPPAESVSRHDTFTAKVRIDNEGKCINAADISINYPQDSLRIIDVSTGDSIFTLWVEQPSINTRDGVVRFAGGIPGGYCGRVPGDPGLTNVLATLVFQAPGEARPADTFPLNVNVDFDEASRVYMHDGFGTEIEPRFFGMEFELTEDTVEGSGQWFEFLDGDNTPPAPFTIEITRDPSMFAGRYFIVFSTTDKESGISHYEVLERKIEEDKGLFARFAQLRRTEDVWRKAESPHVLSDQTLNSMIMVRAIDKAGNERVESLIPAEYMRQASSTSAMQALIGTLFVALAAGVAIRYLYPKLAKSKSNA